MMGWLRKLFGKKSQTRFEIKLSKKQEAYLNQLKKKKQLTESKM